MTNSEHELEFTFGKKQNSITQIVHKISFSVDVSMCRPIRWAQFRAPDSTQLNSTSPTGKKTERFSVFQLSWIELNWVGRSELAFSRMPAAVCGEAGERRRGRALPDIIIRSLLPPMGWCADVATGRWINYPDRWQMWLMGAGCDSLPSLVV